MSMSWTVIADPGRNVEPVQTRSSTLSSMCRYVADPETGRRLMMSLSVRVFAISSVVSVTGLEPDSDRTITRFWYRCKPVIVLPELSTTVTASSVSLFTNNVRTVPPVIVAPERTNWPPASVSAVSEMVPPFTLSAIVLATRGVTPSSLYNVPVIFGDTKSQFVLFPASVQLVQLRGWPPDASLSLTFRYCSVSDPPVSRERKETRPVMPERILRLLVSVPRSRSAPLTDVFAEAANVRVAAVEPLLVRLWKTVEPEIVWSIPLSTTEPELWLKVAFSPFIQEPESVMVPGVEVNVPAESVRSPLISRAPVAVYVAPVPAITRS